MNKKRAVAILNEYSNRQEVKKLHATGLTNRKIATIVGIHHTTVGNYLKMWGLKPNFANQPIDMVSDKEARCRRCGDVKSINEFQYGRKGQKYEYRFSYCNTCRKKQVRENLNNDVNKFLANSYNRTKLRAKNQGINFSISREDFIQQYHNQKGLCFYTDIPMICKVYRGLDRNALSVDKLIPEKGYCVGNLVFATHRINTCKCDLSLEEIQKWMPEWYKRISSHIGGQMKNNQMPDWRQNRIDNIKKRAEEELKDKSLYFTIVSDIITDNEMDELKDHFPNYDVSQVQAMINTDEIAVIIKK